MPRVLRMFWKSHPFRDLKINVGSSFFVPQNSKFRAGNYFWYSAKKCSYKDHIQCNNLIVFTKIAFLNHSFFLPTFFQQQWFPSLGIAWTKKGRIGGTWLWFTQRNCVFPPGRSIKISLAHPSTPFPDWSLRLASRSSVLDTDQILRLLVW